MKKDPVIIAIVQARLGSTRLPGKVLLDVNGRPMLFHVMRRAMASKRITKTILATADNPQNKPIVDFAKKYGFECYAGSEIDLVDRFYQPCKKEGADIVVRITADCPLIDPDLIDRTIEYYIVNAGDIDYVNCNRPHKLPHGLDAEVFPMSTLETLWREAEGEFGREWFITNILDHPQRWRIGDIGFEEDISDYRWTVDYPEDMALVREIFSQLDSDEKVFGLRDILNLYKKRPELEKINANRTHQTVQMGIDEARKKAEKKDEKAGIFIRQKNIPARADA